MIPVARVAAFEPREVAPVCRPHRFFGTAFIIIRDQLADSAASLCSGRGRIASAPWRYLAHGGALTTGDTPLSPLFGPFFGTLYDLSAVSILCLAGASVSLGLRDFVPPYLHRLGMESELVACNRRLVYLFMAIKLIVTIVFHADLDAQRNAYATAVLALMTGAAYACFLDRRSRKETIVAILRGHRGRLGVGCIAAIVGQPSGLKIASVFCFRRLDHLDDFARISGDGTSLRRLRICE